MVKERKIIQLKFKTNASSVDVKFIFQALFKKYEQAEKAIEIVKLAAKKDLDPDALYEQDYNKNMKKLEMTGYEYFSTIRKLKQAGILYKNRGRYRVSRELPRILSKMSSRLNEFYDDLGIKVD